MYTDPFSKQSIYQEQIWNSSQCLWHENTVMDFLRHLVISKGYQPADTNHKVWKKGNRTVVVCLVDDLSSCGNNYDVDVPYLFDTNTTVITDNFVTCPTQYKIYKLPDSFFGIYSHTTQDTIWNPTRNFTLAVNRLDAIRLEIFLEIIKNMELSDGHINFNCFQHDNNDAKLAFDQQWQQLPKVKQELYQYSYDHIQNSVPFRNYDFEHQQSYYSSYLNITIETYSGNNVIAISEKTFRSLTSPAPWTLFAGRYSVAYLSSLGFDVLADVVDHTYYDKIMLDENKVDAFVWQSKKAVNRVKETEFDKLQQRCAQASVHNLELLQNMRNNWPQDFVQWLTKLEL